MSKLLVFEDAPVAQEQAPEGAAMTAVECQQQIERLKLEIEVLTARRDTAIKDALAGGVKVYSGYTFVAKTPSATISEKKLAETHPDIFEQYLTWYQQTHAPKLSKTDLAKYLKVTEHQNPDAILEDCTEPGKGGPSYSLVKNKEAAQ